MIRQMHFINTGYTRPRNSRTVFVRDITRAVVDVAKILGADYRCGHNAHAYFERSCR